MFGCLLLIVAVDVKEGSQLNLRMVEDRERHREKERKSEKEREYTNSGDDSGVN